MAIAACKTSDIHPIRCSGTCGQIGIGIQSQVTYLVVGKSISFDSAIIAEIFPDFSPLVLEG